MPSKNILVLDKKESLWHSFLKECFEDTCSVLHSFDHPAHASAWLAQGKADMVLVNPSLLSMNLAQKLKVLRESQQGFRLFAIGFKDKSLPFDDAFEANPMPVAAFQKKLVQHLEYGEKIRVLIVDDEKDIGHMIKDFLLDRVHPSFDADYTENGHQALEWLDQKKYDVIVTDVKMPALDGRDLYRKIIEKKIKIGVIVFFDAISGEEITDIYKIGRPAIVDKGSSYSNMTEMLSLIKKMAYFG